jgi:hypothetical protein
VAYRTRIVCTVAEVIMGSQLYRKREHITVSSGVQTGDNNSARIIRFTKDFTTDTFGYHGWHGMLTMPLHYADNSQEAHDRLKEFVVKDFCTSPELVKILVFETERRWNAYYVVATQIEQMARKVT